MVRLSCSLQNSGLTARLHDSTSSPSRSADRSLIRGASTASVQTETTKNVFLINHNPLSVCYVCVGVTNYDVSWSLSPCVVIGGSADGGVTGTGVPSSDNELLVQAATLHSLSTPAASLSRLHRNKMS